MRLNRLGQVGARARFLAVGMVALALGGCASSGAKIDDSVDVTDRFVAYEADVQRNFIELGDCIIKESQNDNPLFRYALRGSLRTLARYDLRLPVLPGNKGVSGVILHLHKVDNENTKLFLTPRYRPSINEFVDESHLIDQVSTCANGNLKASKSYSDNQKRYSSGKKEIVKEEVLGVIKALAAVDLPEYDNKGSGLQRMVLRKARSRARLSSDMDTLFIESVLSGELKPVDRYYTDEIFGSNFKAGYTALGNGDYGVLFGPISRAFSDQLKPYHFSLLCFTYGNPGGLFSDAKATDERGVVLMRNKRILDGVIVNEDHPFYQACRSGEEIHS